MNQPFATEDLAVDIVELVVRERFRRRYVGQLLRHPDPRDPDFPGYQDEDEDQEGEE